MESPKRPASASSEPDRGKQPRGPSVIEVAIRNRSSGPVPYGTVGRIRMDRLRSSIDRISILEPVFTVTAPNGGTHVLMHCGILDLDMEVEEDEKLFMNDTTPSAKPKAAFLAFLQENPEADLNDVAMMCPPFKRVLDVVEDISAQLTAHMIEHSSWFTGGKGFRLVIHHPELIVALPDPTAPGRGNRVRDHVLIPFFEKIGVNVEAWLKVHDSSVHVHKHGVKTDLFVHPDSGFYPGFVDENKKFLSRAPDPAFREHILRTWETMAESLPEHGARPLEMGSSAVAGPVVPVVAVADSLLDKDNWRFRFIVDKLAPDLHRFGGSTIITQIKYSVPGNYYTVVTNLPGCFVTPTHSSPKAYLILDANKCTFKCHSTDCTKALRKLKPLSTYEVFGRMGRALLFIRNADAICTAMNEQYGILKIKDAMVIDKKYQDPICSNSIRLVSFSTFKKAYTSVQDLDVGYGVSRFDLWRYHPHCHGYTDIIFDPSKAVGHCGTHYNVWKGFAVSHDEDEAPDTRHCERMLNHIREVIANGNEDKYNYLVRWMAHAVQQPAVLPEVAIVLNGEEGCGKGRFVSLFKSIFGVHFRAMGNSLHFNSQFNGWMRGLLIIFVDEAFFAGDRQNQGTMYALITEPTTSMQDKGIDISETRNYIRLILASNHGWVVPAGRTARRFAVFDVSSKYKGDRAYFEALSREMQDPRALQAFFGFLQQLDLSEFEPRNLPSACASALWRNKMYGLDALHQWFYDIVQENTMKTATQTFVWPSSTSEDGRPTDPVLVVSKHDVFDCYCEFIAANKSRYLHKQPKHIFFRDLYAILTRVATMQEICQRTDNVRFIRFPPLERCRRAFEEEVETPAEVLWQE